MAGRK